MGEEADYIIEQMTSGRRHSGYHKPPKKKISYPFPNLNKEKEMLEKEIEDKSVRYAKKKGWLAYKFTSPSRRSVPDRLFISPRAEIVFVEFKKKGGKPTDGQVREITRLREQGCYVFIFDDLDLFKIFIDTVS
jgi:hypothetical protein